MKLNDEASYNLTTQPKSGNLPPMTVENDNSNTTSSNTTNLAPTTSGQTHFPYIHGFSQEEQNRLRKQARFAEHAIYRDVDFMDCEKVLEIGSGVGAQSEILLRRFPDLHLTCVDMSEAQIEAAKTSLAQFQQFQNRYEILKADAMALPMKGHSFDGAFICWVLEHVKTPVNILAEARRVLKPGAKIFITEVMNSSFFLDPYSPHLWKYWMAFNDFQIAETGDPFVGAKLGNLLIQAGFKNVQTEVKTWHFDQRQPEKRRVVIEYWTELLLSAAPALLKANCVNQETIDGMKKELAIVSKDPRAVFFYSFIQAQASV